MIITIGKSSTGPIALDVARLVESRLLVTAASGGGKSWLLRKILEEVSATTQTIVIDPEGEFASLRELRDMVLVGPDGDIPADPRSAGLLCRRLMEKKVSAVIDIFELTPTRRREFVAAFCTELVNLPKIHWRPLIVAIDEVHEFAPEEKDYVSSDPVRLLNSKGRKRGFAMIGATQRLAKLDKDVAAELKNRFLGQAVLDVDQKRAADFLGFAKNRWPELRDLAPGEFFAVGPALNERGVVKFQSGKVKTTHPQPGEGRKVEPPQPSKAIAAVLGELKDLPQQAEEESRTLADAHKQIADLKRQLASKAPVVDQQATDRAVSQAVAARDREWQAAVKERDGIIDTLKRRMTKAESGLTEVVSLLHVNGEATVKQAAPTKVVYPTGKEKSPPPERKVFTSQVKTNRESGSGDIPPRQQRFLDAAATLATLGADVTRETVSAWVGVHPRGGSVGEVLKALEDAGLITIDRGRITVTDAGADAAGQVDPAQAIERAKSGLTPRQAKFFEVICRAWPGDVSREDIATEFGIHPRGGSLGEDLGRLAGRGLVDAGKGRYRARDFLFAGT